MTCKCQQHDAPPPKPVTAKASAKNVTIDVKMASTIKFALTRSWHVIKK